MPTRFVQPAAYIMASRPLGVLYVGSTSDIGRRVYEHREGLVDGFTKQHGCRMLVWYELHELMTAARARELALKHWLRVWKLELIEAGNPEWRDLYEEVMF